MARIAVLICMDAPTKGLGIQTGDMVMYSVGCGFISFGNPYREGKSSVPMLKPLPYNVAMDNGFRFKEIRDPQGPVFKRWFRKFRIFRHPDWECYPDRWVIQKAWRWSKKWHAVEAFDGDNGDGYERTSNILKQLIK